MRVGKDRKKYSPPMKDEQIARSIELYKSGWSLHQIGREMDRSFMTIWALLKKHGVERRPDAPKGKDNRLFRGGALADTQAISQVQIALQCGRLKRPDRCQWCFRPNKLTSRGQSYIQAHHWNYNRPLDVLWLCKKCHHEWHTKFKAIKKGETAEAPQTLCS